MSAFESAIALIIETLKADPKKWFDKDFQILRDTILECEKLTDDEDSDEDVDEDLPPLSNFQLLKELEEKLKATPTDTVYIKKKCSQIIKENPNFAKAHRIKSMALWIENKAEEAYASMCEAQSLDFLEEYEIIHKEMKERCVLDNKKQAESSQSLPSNSVPTNYLPTNLPFDPSLLNNPEFQKTAQSLMSDPNMMQMMQGLVQNLQK
jgi:hypothetical protein